MTKAVNKQIGKEEFGIGKRGKYCMENCSRGTASDERGVGYAGSAATVAGKLK